MHGANELCSGNPLCMHSMPMLNLPRMLNVPAPCPFLCHQALFLTTFHPLSDLERELPLQPTASSGRGGSSLRQQERLDSRAWRPLWCLPSRRWA